MGIMKNEFFEKVEQKPAKDLFWNVPETKMGAANVIGGNGQSFQIVVRTAEFLEQHFPLKTVKAVLPEALEGKLPALPNLEFLAATEAGTFKGEGLAEALAAADYNLVVGDLSKNKVTGKALAAALAKAEKPVIASRDAVDLAAEYGAEEVCLNAKISFLASAQQLQKLLRAMYYPKVMTLSQSLLAVAEILHKFTLSFPIGIVTLYNGQIVIAKEGMVKATALENSGFSPITMWGGQLAARILALNLYNPGKFVEASVAAVLMSDFEQMRG